MKSIALKIYERILAEAKKNDTAEELKPTKKKLNKPKKEAPDDAILGNYAFANSREGLPPEVNTKVEDKLEKELTIHFANNKTNHHLLPYSIAISTTRLKSNTKSVKHNLHSRHSHALRSS